VPDSWPLAREAIHRPARSRPRTKVRCRTASSCKWIQLVPASGCPRLALSQHVVNELRAKRFDVIAVWRSRPSYLANSLSPGPRPKWCGCGPEGHHAHVAGAPDQLSLGDRRRRSRTCASRRLTGWKIDIKKCPGITDQVAGGLPKRPPGTDRPAEGRRKGIQAEAEARLEAETGASVPREDLPACAKLYPLPEDEFEAGGRREDAQGEFVSRRAGRGPLCRLLMRPGKRSRLAKRWRGPRLLQAEAAISQDGLR